MHPSAIRLSVVGKNQLLPGGNEQPSANSGTQHVSPDGFRGPKPFDRRRSDQPAAPSLVQMIQQNQRTVEAQVRLMKSNSNSLLPCLPAGVYTYNSSLTLTPDASTHIKAATDNQKRAPGDENGALKHIKRNRQNHAHSNVNLGPQASHGLRNSGHLMPPIVGGDKIPHGSGTLKTIDANQKKQQIAKTTSTMVSNPLRINIPTGEGKQTFLTAHLIRIV